MKKVLLTLGLVVVIVCSVFSQQIVTGKVTDGNRMPIPGTDISVKGTEIIAGTDEKGNYSIFTPAGNHMLIVKKEGYVTVDTVVGKNVMDIIMERRVDYFDITLKELMNIQVVTTSAVSETLLDAPAAMVVISEKDIEQRGYTSLNEILYDLPGFDIAFSNSEVYINAYQRGYRTGKTQRTLFIVDGKVDNHLWVHDAQLSRQYPMGIIKQIEVLYGPVSAVYGPNAFLGVINIITKDGTDLEDEEMHVRSNLQAGSWNTKGGDIFLAGKRKDFAFSFGGRLFTSDEPDLSDKWGYSSEEWLSNEDVWGPILELESRNVKLGGYKDISEDYGVMGEISYKGFNLDLLHWNIKEGYGTRYAADRAQVNGGWENISTQVSMSIEKNFSEEIRGKTLMLYRKNFVGGDFAEAIPDMNDNRYSYISYTNWASRNNSILFTQEIFYEVHSNFTIYGSAKLEHKHLTKAYDVPGYWTGSYGSTTIAGIDTGLYGFGAGIGHSTDEVYNIPPVPAHKMPNHNIVVTDDLGGSLQGIYNLGQFRFNAGLRYDENSVYGSSLNPRLSAIYKVNGKGALKLIYGEAFQEPPPVFLWGGWSGRQTNSKLKPEKARNLEFIWVKKMEYLLHDISVFYAAYENVIKEETENSGTRKIYGLEYRMRYLIPNFISASARISGYAYYSFIVSKSSKYYNHSVGEWLDGETAIGDIAPHKIHIGLNFPVKEFLNINLRGNYVSPTELYSRNPMRQQGRLDGYFVLNGTVTLKQNHWSMALKINNILNKKYFHPGIDAADAGNDFTNRSLGFHNSILPQPERNFMVNLTFQY